MSQEWKLWARGGNRHRFFGVTGSLSGAGLFSHSELCPQEHIQRRRPRPVVLGIGSFSQKRRFGPLRHGFGPLRHKVLVHGVDMTNSAAEKRVQGELNMNTAVLPALAIPSNQKHQPMKTSLQKRFARTTGLALAIALGLAVDNATAAISAITNPTSSDFVIGLKFDGINLTVSSNDGYYLRMTSMQGDLILDANDPNDPPYNADRFTPGVVSAGAVISSSLNFGFYISQSLPNTQYYGFAYGTGSGQSPKYHYGWVNLTVSNDAITLNSAAINTAAGESILAGQTTATAVPEPGTLLPAAALVAGALLRRRRGRASRSGGAAA